MTTRKPVSLGRYRAFLQVLRSADGLWDASRRFLAPWGISPSQFNVLHLLSDLPAGCSQIEVGRLLITHRSNVTGLVDRLVRRGWVARRDSNHDRRAYRIVLRAPGRAKLNRILPAYYRAADGMWKGAAIGSPARLAAELSRLCQNAEQKVKGSKASRSTVVRGGNSRLTPRKPARPIRRGGRGRPSAGRRGTNGSP